MENDMKKMMAQHKGLTAAQTRAFWKAFGAACQALGHATTAEKEAYRKRLMRELCRKEHMADLNRTTDFEALMARFAEDAGDFEKACHYGARGGEARTAWLIEQCARQMMEICQAMHGAPDWGDPAQYVRDVCKQAGIGVRGSEWVGEKKYPLASWWMDVPDTLARKVLSMLDTHRRRLLKRAGNTNLKLAFDPNTRYGRGCMGGVALDPAGAEPPPPACFKVKVVA
jgi:hypothetical protein